MWMIHCSRAKKKHERARFFNQPPLENHLNWYRIDAWIPAVVLPLIRRHQNPLTYEGNVQKVDLHGHRVLRTQRLLPMTRLSRGARILRDDETMVSWSTREGQVNGSTLALFVKLGTLCKGEKGGHKGGW
jgi:hypothetical protein